jgi:hypothetical protein
MSPVMWHDIAKRSTEDSQLKDTYDTCLDSGLTCSFPVVTVILQPLALWVLFGTQALNIDTLPKQ